jgi:hypothetical protein
LRLRTGDDCDPGGDDRGEEQAVDDLLARIDDRTPLDQLLQLREGDQ